MNWPHHFDFSRFWLLMKLEFFRSKKGILMTFLIIFDLLFIVGFLLEIFIGERKDIYDHSEYYATNLILGGFILSSLAFYALGNEQKRHQYLTLPVSTFEKFLSMWLLTSVGWIVAFTITYFFYTLIVNALGNVFFTHLEFIPFNPLGSFELASIQYYFVLQGIFLVAATHFRGYVFPKTVASILVFALGCLIVGYAIMADLMEPGFEDECLSQAASLKEMISYQMWTAAQWIFWWLLAPLTWIATFIGLKEQEI